MKKNKIIKECSALDKAFFEWLYIRAQAYLKEADGRIDLTDKSFEYEGYEYTQENLIRLMIYYLSLILRLKSYDANHIELGNKIINLWGILWPYMWF